MRPHASCRHGTSMPATLPAPPRATGEPMRTPHRSATPSGNGTAPAPAERHEAGKSTEPGKPSGSLELYLFMFMIVLGVLAAIVAFIRM